MSENQDYESQAKLTPEEEKIKRVFMFSFMHSQGAPHLQEQILKYVGRHMSNLNIPRTMPEHFGPSIPKLHRSLVGSIGTTGSEEELSRKKRLLENAVSEGNWINFYEGANRPIEKSAEPEVLTEITKLLVERDIYYIDLGRPGRGQNGKTDTSHDQYASFFRNYVIFKKSSGDELYDEMYNGVRETHKELIAKDSEYQKNFEELVSIWEDKHPGEKFMPERQEVNEAS